MRRWWFILVEPFRRVRVRVWRWRHPYRAAEVDRHVQAWERTVERLAERYEKRTRQVSVDEWRDAMNRYR